MTRKAAYISVLAAVCLLGVAPTRLPPGCGGILFAGEDGDRLAQPGLQQTDLGTVTLEPGPVVPRESVKPYEVSAPAEAATYCEVAKPREGLNLATPIGAVLPSATLFPFERLAHWQVEPPLPTPPQPSSEIWPSNIPSAAKERSVEAPAAKEPVPLPPPPVKVALVAAPPALTEALATPPLTPMNETPAAPPLAPVKGSPKFPAQPSSPNVKGDSPIFVDTKIGTVPPVNEAPAVPPIPAQEAPAVPPVWPKESPSKASPAAPRAAETLAPVPVEGARGKEGRAPTAFEILDQAEELSIIMRRSKLLRSAVDITRTVVVDPNICDVTQYSLREVGIIGKSLGSTHVTFWFQDPVMPPRTYLIRVTPDPETKSRREQRYSQLESIIAKVYPNSKVKLVAIGPKMLVTGQAWDAAEAAEIMTLIRGEVVDQRGRWISGPGTGGNQVGGEDPDMPFPAGQIINMLKIPGVQQVALRVKIAELNRTAARSFGVDMKALVQWKEGAILLQSLVNAGSGKSIIGRFDQDKLNFGIHYLEEHGVVRMLSEPTLVTLSGRTANFVAGGEFAVPTVVGVSGASAVTTDFRAFGAIIRFTPVVLDKDRIRLDVSPEFSQVNAGLSVGGTPGLTTRTVNTTVEMREGQTLAIAGLLDDSMKSDTAGDVPFLTKVFGGRNVSRQETELIILVTPELVHPMEPEEVPPLPGFDVTEPNNCEFFFKGDIEGTPTQEYRSTVWPRLQQRYKAGGTSMISGPFGHSDSDVRPIGRGN